MRNIDRVPAKSSALVLIAAWLIVTVPAGWGVAQMIRKSLALFISSAPQAVTPAPVSDQSSRH